MHWRIWGTIGGLALGGAMLLPRDEAKAQATLCYGRPITVLNMSAPTLVSGTALQAGAIYRFANAAPGIDVRVRIDALNGATLATIDNDTGLVANFQPELAGANARSIDFTISFVVAGTTTPLSLDVAASGVDVDGDSGSIREYAEFSTPYAAYVLDNPTNLDVNASGPSAPNRTRFESRTNFTAPGIDETATANIVVAFYTSTSSFQYRIGALGTGATTRLTSLDFACPNLALPTPSTIVPQDFGDAPASYGNPVHDLVTGVRLGATNTSEPARYNSPTASGDAGDDGVTFPAVLRRSAASTTNVATVGSGGRLQAWFDWNGDGDFADAGEQVASDVGDNLAGDSNPAAGTIGLSITPPAAAVLTQTFARFRWSTTTGLPSGTTTASNGEVEDYAVTVFGPALLTLAKSSNVYDPLNQNLFAVPGNDIFYTVTATNTGTGPADSNSIFLLDTLPTTLEFYNGDVDDGGPATDPVIFTAGTSGLTFTPATDLRYSNLAAAPANFAACTYTPVAGYDPAVRHICFNPKGAMLSGTPQPSFSVQFRTRIR